MNTADNGENIMPMKSNNIYNPFSNEVLNNSIPLLDEEFDCFDDGVGNSFHSRMSFGRLIIEQF